MLQSFDTFIAKHVGVLQSLLLKHFKDCAEATKANPHIHASNPNWTPGDIDILLNVFPYMSKREINMSIKSLIKDGYLIKGESPNPSVSPKIWYAITEKSETLFFFCD